jgi:transposase
MKRPITLDLRLRILASYDQNEGTRTEMAHRFRVSLGMVKKLVQQRRHSRNCTPVEWQPLWISRKLQHRCNRYA